MACSSTDPREEEFSTADFDIWIGCQLKKLPDGQVGVIAKMGGNPMLFMLLLEAVEMMGQKLGVFPPPSDDDPFILSPYDVQGTSHDPGTGR